MNETIQTLLHLEKFTQALHQQYYALQEQRLHFVIELAMLNIELRHDNNFELDLDLVEAQLYIWNDGIAQANGELAKLNITIEHNLQKIEAL